MPYTQKISVVLRRARMSARTPAGSTMSTTDLASCLPQSGGFFSRYPPVQPLAAVLDRIEAGAEWPFIKGEEMRFVAECAHALASGDALRERRVLFALCNAMAEDLTGDTLRGRQAPQSGSPVGT